jgi:serine/threonine protein kinase-related
MQFPGFETIDTEVGAYAKVYKVRNNDYGYIRAMKVLLGTIPKEGEQEEKSYKNFLRECRTLFQLGNGSHPNIVHIYGIQRVNNRLVIETDWVNGLPLASSLVDDAGQSRYVELHEVMRLLHDIGSALEYCHNEHYRYSMTGSEPGVKTDQKTGRWVIDESTRARLEHDYQVIHNDIHTGNIIRRIDGTYVLIDFGLSIDADAPKLTVSRVNKGALEFRPPEKWSAPNSLTTTSDIYSFGCALYFFLTGRVPFPEDRNDEQAELHLMEAHKNAPVPSIAQARQTFFERTHPGATYTKDYPDWLESLILKCLEKSPENRFQDGRELMRYVKEHLGDFKSLVEDSMRRDGLVGSSRKTPSTDEPAAAQQAEETVEVPAQPDLALLAANSQLKASLEDAQNKLQTAKESNKRLALQLQQAQYAASQRRNKGKGLWALVLAGGLFIVAASLFIQLNRSTRQVSAANEQLEYATTQARQLRQERDSLNNLLQRRMLPAQQHKSSAESPTPRRKVVKIKRK